jgi:3-deoxy-7-phosphoheptulonate synthase
MAAYLGQPGSFSHMACGQYFGNDAQKAAQPTFRAIFDAVQHGEAQYGVIPLENSLTGSIHKNYDLLLEYDLKIVGELYLRIMHNLIAAPGTRLEDVQRVWATEAAGAQCRTFLNRHEHWELLAVHANASAVRQLCDHNRPGDAAIGSREAAAFHDMQILVEGIETNPRNFTRFVIIGDKRLTEGQRTKPKSSIVFSTINQPGALFEVMKIFAENRINLVKLESRPIHGKPWQYMFYADIEADVMAPALADPMEQIGRKTDFFRILGSY